MPKIRDKCIALWRMEEASGNLTDSVASKVLTASGLTYSQTGKVNNAIDFDGSTSSAQRATDSDLNPGAAGDMTLAVWLNNPAVSATQYVCCTRETGGAGGYNFGVNATDKFQFYVQDTVGGSGNGLTANSDVPSAAFYSAIGTFTRSTDGIHIYINNVDKRAAAIDTSTMGTVSTTTEKFLVGCAENTLQVKGNFYDGLIDEIAYFNAVLNSTDRDVYHNSGSGRNIVALPTLTSVNVTSANQGDSTGTVTLTGDNYDLSDITDIWLSKSGQTNISGTSQTYVSKTSATAVFAIPGSAAPGLWSVNISHANGTGTLTDGFTVNGSPTRDALTLARKIVLLFA